MIFIFSVTHVLLHMGKVSNKELNKGAIHKAKASHCSKLSV